MRHFLLLILPSFFLNACKKDEPARPNILLFIGDDMNCTDCTPYGNSDVYTPNIQRLSEEGMSFDNMHTTTAMCAPTRQQLFSGLYPVRSGAYPNHSEMYDGTKSFATYFNALGYRTGLIGKEHQGPKSSFPYEYFGGRHHDNGNGRDIELEKIEHFITDPNDKPYFLVIAQNQPHSPWNRGDRSLYNPDELSVPDYYIDTEKTRQLLANYYAEITYADSLLGVCMDFVNHSDQAENTIVIFTSEQGSSFPYGKWTCWDLGLKTAFIIAWPGKIKPGTRNRALTQYVDVLPTLIDLAGYDPDTVNTGNKAVDGSFNFDGSSFSDVLFKENTKHRDYVYGLQTTRGIYYGSDAYAIRSIRNSQFKLIWNINYENLFSNMVTYSKNGIYAQWKQFTEGTQKHDRVMLYEKRPEYEFYDIINDPYELQNLIDNPKYAEQIELFRNELSSWMESQGDEGHETEMKAKQRQVQH